MLEKLKTGEVLTNNNLALADVPDVLSSNARITKRVSISRLTFSSVKRRDLPIHPTPVDRDFSLVDDPPAQMRMQFVSDAEKDVINKF